MHGHTEEAARSSVGGLPRRCTRPRLGMNVGSDAGSCHACGVAGLRTTAGLRSKTRIRVSSGEREQGGSLAQSDQRGADMYRLRLWAVVAAVLACATGFSAAEAAAAKAGSASAVQATGAARQTADARIAWKGCGKRLQCARVRVPLDWARPGLGTISLAVARHLASRPGQRIGSLFVNYGGPGVAGVPTVKAGGAELDKLGQGRFDVVGWDPRGAGREHARAVFR